ncbi:protein phosphatase [Pseudomonas pohangensis]|uniref:Protein phosphatase n=1 Tax=Pseudomonas pohangensis TaxID=364197 RepID=A0A1H2G0D5_9PSED|nr:protein phosphatase 2C domain-containing protein [Pseudomonas pohangensis]SDU13032.1 protein phosphatase [Pseudomonas pohangensis]
MSISPTPNIHFAALSDPGLTRAHNEDSLLCCAGLNLWAVADGMGGHQRGEVASALALEVLREQVEVGTALPEAVVQAHAAILAAADGDPAGQGMGTTLVAVQLAGDQFTLAWVGDSRAYRISMDRIEPLSRDHSWVQEMVDAGEMTSAEARQHPRRNVITQCLGQAGHEPQPGVLAGQLQPGEILLLCSDGLTGELSDEQILACCAAAETLDGLVSQLIRAANQSGGKDNVSCIVLACEAPPPSVEAGRRGLLGYLFPRRQRNRRNSST